jgi:ABC-type transport system involved in cytochrome bd biosynthesis fused ATPase/permease subunit
MTTTSPGRLLFKKIGKTHRWVVLSSLLGIIPIGSGIGLFAFALYLLTKSALLGTAASVSLTILGVRFFAVTRVVGRYCERYLGHLGTFRVLARLRIWLFERLIETDSTLVANQRRGDVVTGLVDDVDTMQDRLLRVSSPPFVALGTLLIAIAVLMAINFQSAVILTAFFLAGALILPPVLWSRTRQLSAQLIRLRAQRLTEATELIDGFETLTIWGRADQLSESIRHFDLQESLVSRKLARIRALLGVAVIALTGMCVLVIVAALRTTEVSAADIYWLAAVPLVALASFEALGPLLLAPDFRAQSDEAAARILAIAGTSTTSSPAERTQSITPQQVPTAPTIRVSNLSFAYGDSAPIFVGASVTIPFGSTVAIAAPSGTGKSTLLELLVGLLPCQDGAVSIDGHQPAELQGLPRPCGTAGLLPFIDARPGGLDAPIGPNGDELSGGERQRLMIARALLADAPILVLDEATEHLEPALRFEVLNAILASRVGRTTVMLAHEIDTVDRVDITYDLINGTFVVR